VPQDNEPLAVPGVVVDRRSEAREVTRAARSDAGGRAEAADDNPPAPAPVDQQALSERSRARDARESAGEVIAVPQREARSASYVLCVHGRPGAVYARVSRRAM
jgi:hypothetical protein